MNEETQPMIVAIIQARMQSTRLPGKVLKPILGKPMLLRQIERIRGASTLDKVVVATSDLAQDDPIAELCKGAGIDVFRGSEHDVLSRYFHAATAHAATVVVRLTGDCPLADPEVIDAAVRGYLGGTHDYFANTVPPETSSYPDGLDVEVFSFAALARAHAEVTDLAFREHVTFDFWRTPGKYRTGQLRRDDDASKLRLTVDYPEDFEVVSEVFRLLAERGTAGHVDELIDILRSTPELAAKNGAFYFGIGWQAKPPAAT